MITPDTASLAALLLALALPGTLYLAILTLAGVLSHRRPEGEALKGRVAIVIPAHNEAAVISHTLASLLPLAWEDGETTVVVVADNCRDATAAIARSAGAHVIERRDLARRGKGYALNHAFDLLMREDFKAFIVVDADSTAAPNFLPAMRAALGAAGAAQARYVVRNGHASPRTRLASVALAGFNVLRPRGRSRLGLSVGILGNGFALRRETLEQVPYTAASVVEDHEYHLKLLQAGHAVAFVDDTSVHGDMPTGSEGARTQRIRWEGGRLRMAREHAGSLVQHVLRGRFRMIEPLADLMLLPLAYHVLLIAGAGLLAALGSGAITLWLALLCLLVVGLHVVAAVHVARLPWTHLLSLLRLPAYLLWKLRILSGTWSGAGRQSAWVRTNRSGR